MAEKTQDRDKILASIRNPMLRDYTSKGFQFIDKMKATGRDPSHAIRPGEVEWRAWTTYFRRHLGIWPWAMDAAERREIESATVPAQWPQWFDKSFMEDAA